MKIKSEKLNLFLMRNLVKNWKWIKWTGLHWAFSPYQDYWEWRFYFFDSTKK